MNIRSVLTVVLALASSICPSSWAQQPGGSLDSLIRSSHIIFMGRIIKLRAANLLVVTPTENTAVVHVEELLDAPPGVAGLKGQDVTVELLRPEATKLEQQAVFFTNGVLFGQHLAVKEVGQIPVPGDLAQLRAQVAGVRTRISEEQLQARISSAVLVTTGKVLETKEIERIGGISEHEPDWAVAVVEIETIDKGSFDGKTVSVYFPQSTDERWLLSPKFRAGQQGIWILHSELGLPGGVLTALNPLDFQPLAEKGNIQRLLH